LNTNDQVRAAFLILAHDDAAHLSRLISRIAPHRWAKPFVHLDAKANLDDFKSSDALFLKDNRVSVNWCGFTMVDATLRLMREALSSDFCPNRFILLSGSDYPIKPMADFKDALSSDTQWIQIDRELNEFGRTHFDRCANRMYLGDHKLLHDRARLAFVPQAVRNVERVLRRGFPQKLRLFYGPSWWALTREAVQHVISAAESNPQLVGWFRKTRSPDEMFFQTLLKSSAFAQAIRFDATRQNESSFGWKQQCLHHVDWENPNPISPRVMLAEDFDSLATSGAFFARKFSSTRSEEALDMIDKQLL
jgi:hypothetical protein